MKVVFVAGVVFSGSGWRGEAHRCLLADRGDGAKHSPAATLSWYQDHVKRVEPAPLGKQRSRDLKDDPYLACALGAGAKIIVTRDDDLLVLEKPFGIQIITPRALLVRLSKPF